MSRITGSEPFSLNRDDTRKILIGAALAAAAAVIDYLLVHVIPGLADSPGVNATLIAVLSVVLNAARKWITDTRQGLPFWVLPLLLVGVCQ